MVSTRSGGPDGIIQDGIDGYIVPRDDPDTMSRRLLTLIDDPEANVAMGLLARKTIESRYDEYVAGRVFVEMWDALVDI